MPIELPPNISDSSEKPVQSMGVSTVRHTVEYRVNELQKHTGIPNDFDAENNVQFLECIKYLETDPNASTIWNPLWEAEIQHIKWLIARVIHKGQDPDIHNLYGAIDILKKAKVLIESINTLKMLYIKSKQINTENDTKKAIEQYVQDFILVLGEEYTKKEESEKEVFRWELTETMGKHLNKWLHDSIMTLLGKYDMSITLPKDKKWNPIHITRTYLAGLSSTQPTREIGKIESIEFPYTIYALRDKKDMKNESDILGHCVWESNYYIEKVDKWEILIFSLRDANEKPHWTIEYNIKERSMAQFKWGGDVAVNSIPENKDLFIKTLDTITQAGYPVEKITESFGYSILRDQLSNTYESSTGDILKEKCLSGKYHLFYGSLTLSVKDTETDILALCQLPWLSLDLTDVSQDIKDQITEVQWELIDSSKSVSYKALTSIGKGAYFDNLTSTKGFEKLSNVWGDANFSSLTSAKGLEKLLNIWEDAHFNKLKSAEGLESLSSIWGDAFFINLNSAKGLESLTCIGRGAYFKDLKSAKGLESLSSIWGEQIFNSLTRSEKQKIPALHKWKYRSFFQ